MKIIKFNYKIKKLMWFKINIFLNKKYDSLIKYTIFLSYNKLHIM